MPQRFPLKIDELNANHAMVSVPKYGFFLCRQGTARVLFGSNTYQIARNYLCVYAPNTFLQILEKSDDLEGILMEDDIKTYHPVLNPIDIRKRLQIRSAPCVEVTQAQADEMVRLYERIRSNEEASDICLTNFKHKELTQKLHEECLRHLLYALCLKVVEAYFCNTPVVALPQSKEDGILNRFLVSVYDNCHKQRTVQYYADEQHLSPYYFSSIIRERSGKSALQWIAHITMTFSKQYLECADLSIKEIADRLHFPDQSAFGRYFKHHEGCSPTEFREKKMRR